MARDFGWSPAGRPAFVGIAVVIVCVVISGCSGAPITGAGSASQCDVNLNVPISHARAPAFVDLTAAAPPKTVRVDPAGRAAWLRVAAGCAGPGSTVSWSPQGALGPAIDAVPARAGHGLTYFLAVLNPGYKRAIVTVTLGHGRSKVVAIIAQ